MARHIEQKHKAIYEELCLFTENCTTSPKSVQNYTDFKRINECINEVLGKEDVSILDFTDPIEFTELIKLLNSNEKYKSYNKKGNNQYSSAVLNYQNFLFARHYAELVKTNSDTLNLQTIINEGLKDSYDQETLIEILKAYREVYASDNVKNNACDVAFGIKYGKFLEKTDTKTISQKASNPDDSNNIQNGYFVNIGVSTYQAICQEKYGLSFTKHQITNNSGDSIDQSLQQIFYGAPGTGKSNAVKRQIGELLDSGKEQDLPNVFRTTFHPDTDYASFVGCYKPTMKPTSKEEKTLTGKDEEIVYEFVPQTFTDAYIYAYTHSTEQTYLVIEEINRGNCAQIFGDLFQLLDRKGGVSEYKIKADKDLANYLMDKLGEEADGIKEGKLCLPANLNILATMNTSDQSLFPMDSAFKRRWEWEYVPINYSTDIKSGTFNITIGDKTYLWVDFIEKANKKIFDLTQSEDKQLGNFFIKCSIDEKEFKSKVMFYLWYEVLRDETENNKYFFYKKTTIEGKDELGKFIFKDLYEPDATETLQQFMEYLGVAPK